MRSRIDRLLRQDESQVTFDENWMGCLFLGGLIE